MPSDKKVLLRITGTTGAGGGQDCHVFPPGRGTCSFRDRTATLVKIEVLVLAEVWHLVESRTGPLRWRWTRAADSKPKSESARSPWSHPWDWQHHREGDPRWQGSFSGKRCIPDHSPSGRSCQFHCRLCYLSSSRLILCNRKERLPLKRPHPPPPLLGPALRRGDIAAWGRCPKEFWALWMSFSVLRHAARHVAGRTGVNLTTTSGHHGGLCLELANSLNREALSWWLRDDENPSDLYLIRRIFIRHNEDIEIYPKSMRYTLEKNKTPKTILQRGVLTNRKSLVIWRSTSRFHVHFRQWWFWRKIDKMSSRELYQR